jgi:hypothetical protein
MKVETTDQAALQSELACGNVPILGRVRLEGNGKTFISGIIVAG